MKQNECATRPKINRRVPVWNIISPDNCLLFILGKKEFQTNALSGFICGMSSSAKLFISDIHNFNTITAILDF